MTWMKKASLFEETEEDREWRRKAIEREDAYVREVASKSELFARLVADELTDDPARNWEIMRNPKSRVRNALILLGMKCYGGVDGDIEAWERDELSRPFFGLSED
jgi:hypothetical protein